MSVVHAGLNGYNMLASINSGTLTSQNLTNSQLVSYYSTGDVDVIYGDFTTLNGRLLGGTITGFSHTLSNGVQQFSITGVNADVMTFYTDSLLGLNASLNLMLFPAHSTYYGSTNPAAFDTLQGYGGSDVFIAGAATETFIPAAGSNTVIGGSGQTTVKFSGALSGYYISNYNNGILSVTDNVTTRNGDTQVSHVQKLAFSDVTATVNGDGTLTVPTANAAMAASWCGVGDLAPVNIVDSASNVIAQLPRLGLLANAGELGTIQLTNTTTPTLTLTASQLSQSGGALSHISGNFNLSVTGASASMNQFLTAWKGSFIPGASIMSNGNEVIGFESAYLGPGHNVVLLDGPRSQYDLQVDPSGKVTLHDHASNGTATISNASYLLFNGGSSSSPSTGSAPSAYDSIYFIQGGNNTQVALLYNAALQRQPDIGGLDYWLDRAKAGTDLVTIADGFLGSAEFTKLYGTESTLSDSQFVNLLYQNVLHRTADPGGLSYWLSDLADGGSRASILVGFSGSLENMEAARSWLIDTTSGGYADSGERMAASTILPTAAASHVLDTGLIDPSTVASGGQTVGGLQLTVSGGVGAVAILPNAAAGQVVKLSSSFTHATIQSASVSVMDGPGNDGIVLTGSVDARVFLGHGGTDTVNVLGGTDAQIIDFSPGKGSAIVVSNAANPASLQVLDGSRTPVDGHTLAFASGTSYVVNIGSVGDDSLATVVAKINSAYKVADIAGNAGAGTAGEAVTFIGADSSGNTQVWYFGATSGIANGKIPASTLAAGADVDGDHLVGGSEIVHLATIVGVLPSALSAADLA